MTPISSGPTIIPRSASEYEELDASPGDGGEEGGGYSGLVPISESRSESAIPGDICDVQTTTRRSPNPSLFVSRPSFSSRPQVFPHFFFFFSLSNGLKSLSPRLFTSRQSWRARSCVLLSPRFHHEESTRVQESTPPTTTKLLLCRIKSKPPFDCVSSAKK